MTAPPWSVYYYTLKHFQPYVDAEDNDLKNKSYLLD